MSLQERKLDIKFVFGSKRLYALSRPCHCVHHNLLPAGISDESLFYDYHDDDESHDDYGVQHFRDHDLDDYGGHDYMTGTSYGNHDYGHDYDYDVPDYHNQEPRPRDHNHRTASNLGYPARFGSVGRHNQVGRRGSGGGRAGGRPIYYSGSVGYVHPGRRRGRAGGRPTYYSGSGNVAPGTFIV